MNLPIVVPIAGVLKLLLVAEVTGKWREP